jgi:hypothetical protein
MAELAALGLASNIIQLITFASDLISKTHEIHKSTQGSLVRHLELEAVSENLRNLAESILELRPRSISQKQPIAKAEEQLQRLCKSCDGVARDLLVALEKLKIKQEHGKWKSFRQALTCIWSENEIDLLAARLEGHRREIDTMLLRLLRYITTLIFYTDLTLT